MTVEFGVLSLGGFIYEVVSDGGDVGRIIGGLQHHVSHVAETFQSASCRLCLHEFVYKQNELNPFTVHVASERSMLMSGWPVSACRVNVYPSF